LEEVDTSTGGVLHKRPRYSRTRLLASAWLAAGIALAGCGTEPDEAAKLRQRSVVTDVEPVPANRVGAADIRARPPGSASRAFLEYWSLLQRQRWHAAMLRFNPRLRREVGSQRIVKALRRLVVAFVADKPRLRREHRRRGHTFVNYVITSPRGMAKRQWIAWRRTAGRWRIFYDPLLDFALAFDAGRSAQERIDSSARRPSKEAKREARRAAQLQRDYLRRLGVRL
jgi:hypothetical protein